MKKLMIAAAVAALTAGAFADSCAEVIEESDCYIGFTVKFSGKTATEAFKNKDGDYATNKIGGDYATVQKISGKGLLVLTDYATETFTSAKVGKKDISGLSLDEGEVYKWSYFGKDLYKVTDEDYFKQGKTTKLESDLGITFEDQGDNEINVDQVAFGKVKVYITKDQTVKGGDCGEDSTVEGCVPEVTPVSYNGWFTGSFTPDCVDWEFYADDCFTFDGDDIALIGGTWSAKYSKKYSSK